MKILIGASSALDRGSGIAAATRALCEGLLELGHEVVLASPALRQPEWLVERGVTHVLTDPHEPQHDSAKRVLAAVDTFSIEAIVNNDNSALQSLAPLVRVPFVSIMHLPTHAIGALAGYNADHLDYLVAISPDMQEGAIRRFRLPIHRVPLIYNGIRDSGEVRTDRKRAAPLRAVFAGGGNPRKGADLMLQFARSVRVNPATFQLEWFDVIPEGTARALAQIPWIKTHGRVSAEVFMSRLGEADIVLLPSRVEGCPMVLLEAMSRGVVPVVSDGVGAMKWIVQSGYNGFICSLQNWSRELQQVVGYSAAHPLILDRFSTHARQTFLTRFTEKHVATFIYQLLCTPTIDRAMPRLRAPVLKWTRPSRPDGSRPSIWERACYRAGLLRTEAYVDA